MGKSGEGMREDIRLSNMTPTTPLSTNSTTANATTTTTTTISMGNDSDTCNLEPAFLCLKDSVHFQR